MEWANLSRGTTVCEKKKYYKYNYYCITLDGENNENNIENTVVCNLRGSEWM